MIDAKAWRPRVPDLPLRFVYASGRARTEGTHVHNIEGTPVFITTPAKTVADCFKYRSLVGLDVAIEALRDLIQQDSHAINEISRYAVVDRVSNVIRPYFEALV
jgi:predicted transcriptional regulator of viral defense system